MREKIDLKQFRGFDWDEGNQHKSAKKHGVIYTECEQLFFNQPLLMGHDEKHSGQEARYVALGKTNQGRRLLVIFTSRGDYIRVISAREMNKKERGIDEAI